MNGYAFFAVLFFGCKNGNSPQRTAVFLNISQWLQEVSGSITERHPPTPEHNP